MRFLPARGIRACSIGLLAAAICSNAFAAADAQLDQLAKFLTGSFSSQAQAQADTDYRDVRLHMVPIWSERRGEHWLYVEQAIATSLDKPYRQRVYRLVQEAGELRSLVYTLPGDPLVFAGAWASPQAFVALQPAELNARNGCTIVLHADTAASYRGATRGHDCASDLKGASYAQSEVSLEAHILRSWDRGFDSSDHQVWGAEKGPYVFVRETAVAAAPPISPAK